MTDEIGVKCRRCWRGIPEYPSTVLTFFVAGPSSLHMHYRTHTHKRNLIFIRHVPWAAVHSVWRQNNKNLALTLQLRSVNVNVRIFCVRTPGGPRNQRKSVRTIRVASFHGLAPYKKKKATAFVWHQKFLLRHLPATSNMIFVCFLPPVIIFFCIREDAIIQSPSPIFIRFLRCCCCYCWLGLYHIVHSTHTPRTTDRGQI